MQGEDLLDEKNLPAIQRYIDKNQGTANERDEFGNTLLYYFIEFIHSALIVSGSDNIEPVLKPPFANFLRMLIGLNPEALHMRNYRNRLVSDNAECTFDISFYMPTPMATTFQPLLTFLLLQGASLGLGTIALLERLSYRNLTNNKPPHHPALKAHLFFRQYQPSITPRMVGIYLRHKKELDTLILQGMRREQVYHATNLPDELLCEIVTLFTGLSSHEFKRLRTHVITRHEIGEKIPDQIVYKSREKPFDPPACF